jgi:endonuclease YncB( thermonuclease family)
MATRFRSTAIVQLYGIDAPELGQYCEHNGELWECGVEAALFLQKTVKFEGPPIECSPWGKEPAGGGSTGLVIGVCQVGPKVVGQTMVQNGYAMALPDSFPEYEEAEKQARQPKLGLWRGEFVPSWEWRPGQGRRGALQRLGPALQRQGRAGAGRRGDLLRPDR